MREIIEFNLDDAEPIKQTTDIYNGRIATAAAMKKISKFDSDVTVLVVGYNRLDKTKRCVESILKYSKNVNYDLVLLDNGSTDGTLEYFKSIEFDKLRIVRVTKNIGSVPAHCMMDLNWFSDYFVSIANDLVVTENWLSNLLAVAKSDPKIGMVNPVCSNTSNFQCVNFDFLEYEEMQEKAKAFNVSDPTKWEERLRLVSLGTLYSKSALYAIGWPSFDVGFFHDFSDDDVTFQIRRAGYKTVLAGDTWIHHDHNKKTGEEKDPVELQNSIFYGRQNFKTKYFGVDAWDDVNRYIFPYLKGKILPPEDSENVKILGVDVRCGTPILDIKNMIREFSAFNPETHAFFKDSKYDIDLRTVCNGSVICDRIDYLYNSFAPNYFDYIVLGENVNEYAEPAKLIQDAFSLLKKGGQLYFSYKNTFDYKTLLAILGYRVDFYDAPLHCSLEDFYGVLQNSVGVTFDVLVNVSHEIDSDLKTTLSDILDTIVSQDENKDIIKKKVFIEKYWLRIVK